MLARNCSKDSVIARDSSQIHDIAFLPSLVPLNLRSAVTPPNPCMRFTSRILYVKYSVVVRDQRGYGGSEDPESQRSVRK